MSAEEWQKQIANLTPAQRVGIVAAVALSCFALYATKNHREICGGPLDSPRHRTNCPLNFLTCAPSNDINESIATLADTIKDFDATAWELPTMPPMPGFPAKQKQQVQLLGCPHDEALASHPHYAQQTCLQCKELRRCSNLLERAYMDWTTKEEESLTTPLLRCPHNERLSPHSTACGRCAERSYTNELERGRMSNWTADHFVEGEGYVIGSLSSSDSASSLQSLIESSQQLLPPQLASVADDVGRGAMAVVAEAERNIAEVRRDVAVMSGSGAAVTSRGGRDSVSTAAMGKSTAYMVSWYLITLCNDKFRIKNQASILSRFPAPHMLQAFGFAFQVFFVYEVNKHRFRYLAPPADHLTWTSKMNFVIPIAVAASFDVALDLNRGGVDDQFNKLCKSASPLFILNISYIFSFEEPTFKLTTSIASITTGCLLTIAKALDYNYDLPDVLALTTGASLSALRWAGAQFLLQTQDKGSPIVTMGRLAPWMTICTTIFSITFEKSWQMIGQLSYFFQSPIDMLEGLGQLLIFYVLWTMEILADFLLIANTSALTFIVVKTLKTVGDLGSSILTKGLYHEERRWIEREKTMNEETIGLYYIVFGLVIFLWQRYQEWVQRRSRITGEGGRENNNSYYLEDGSSEGSSNNGSRGNGGSRGECGRKKSTGKICGTTSCEGEACKFGEVEACAQPGNAQQCSAESSQDLLSPNRQCFHDVF